nr:hypothetical protein [Tanacetum cinerariifolium]
MGDVDINTLIMERYLALTRENHAPGLVKPEMSGNVNFKIKIQFMRDLRENTFLGNKNNDAHEHVKRITYIFSLFNIPRVTHDTVILSFEGIVHHLKQQNSSRRSITSNKKAMRHYQAWERYNDLPYKCPTHDLNIHQKVNIFYKGLDTMTHQLLDSQGPTPNKTPDQALEAIQTMVDHLQKWHDESNSRKVSNGSSDGIAAIANKLDNLGHNIKKLKENMHDIQVGCKTYG